MWREILVLLCILCVTAGADFKAKKDSFIDENHVDIEEEDDCQIQLTHLASSACRTRRNNQLDKDREIYKLKPAGVTPLPSLDLELDPLLKLLWQDAYNREWAMLYPAMIGRNQALAKKFANESRGVQLKSAEDYETVVFRYFVERLHANVPPTFQKYFKLPFQDASVVFRNLTHFCSWREDEVFTDMRLAGLNPMAIQQVSWNLRGFEGLDWGDLSGYLNPSFDWEGAIQDALGLDLDLWEVIHQGHLYAVHYPLFRNLPTVEDLDPRKIMPSYSPIAIFVSKPSRRAHKANRLVPVAIQIDSSEGSVVHTPEDGDQWLLAKQIVNVADYVSTQLVEHLFKTHTLMEPICVCIQRQLSTFHPLHHMLQHHCKGLLGTNKIGLRVLLAPHIGSVDKLLPIGRNGAVQLLTRAYHDVTWEDTNFRGNIKKRGLGDKKMLPYFPYRDDGKLIYSAIEKTVSDYVNLYYKTNGDVKKDQELQQFIKDVSVGQGQVKGFPTKVKRKWMLKRIISQIIWQLSAQHAAVNYPVDYYGAITPIMPTKLYEDPSAPNGEIFGIANLAGRVTSGMQVALAMSLGSFHYDSLFDYADRLVDSEAQRIIKKHYENLNGKVKSIIQERNQRRLVEQHLTYPYLLPGWVTNSIHT